jgi:hypothetical protein
MAMTKKITEIPLILVRRKIPPNLPLLKGGAFVPTLLKGDKGGLSISLVRGLLIQNRKLTKFIFFNY